MYFVVVSRVLLTPQSIRVSNCRMYKALVFFGVEVYVFILLVLESCRFRRPKIVARTINLFFEQSFVCCVQLSLSKQN